MRSRVAHGASIVLGLSTEGRRALEATLADWRHESEAASTTAGQFVVGVRSMLAIVRTLVAVGFNEWPRAFRSAFVLQLGALCTVWMVGQALFGTEPSLERFLVVAPWPTAYLAIAAGQTSALLMAFLPMVFVAEAVGPRDRSAPTVGTLLLLGIGATTLVLVVTPMALAYFRVQVVGYFANVSVPRPDIWPAFWSYVHPLVAVFFLGGSLLMYMLASLVRRVGGLIGWLLGVAPALLAVGWYGLSVRLWWSGFGLPLSRSVWQAVTLLLLVAGMGGAIVGLSRILAERANVESRSV